MTFDIPQDPFALTSNPQAYVPTLALETALDAAMAALSRSSCPAIVGPTGLGKTLLLQLLAHQMEGRARSLYVPFSTLSPLDFAALVLGLLDEPPSEDPERTLLTELSQRYSAERPLLLLIDDAAGLPMDTASAVHEWLEAGEGALLVALAGLPGDALDNVLRKLGTRIEPIALVDGLGDSEIAEYVARKLEAADAPHAVRQAFNGDAIDALRSVAAGNPRQLHLAAQAIVREAEGVEEHADEAPLLEAPGTTAADLARVGEYRFVRGQFVSPETGEQDEAEVAAAAPPPPTPTPPEDVEPDFDRQTVTLPTPPEFLQSDRPAAQVDLTLTATSAPSSQPAGSDADRFPPVPPLLPARPAFPVRAVAIAVASGALVLGIIVASLVDWGGTREQAPVPFDPPQAVAPAPPTPAPTVREVFEPEPAAVEVTTAPPEPTLPIPTPEPIAPPTPEPSPPVAATPVPAPAPEPTPSLRQPEPEPVAVMEPEPAAPEPEPAFEAPAPTPASEPPTVVATPEPVAPVVEPEPEPEPEPAPAPPAAIVSVSINATPWGMIDVDGEYIGETPLAGIAITEGPHEFRARMPDGSVRTKTVTISPQNKAVVFE